MNNNYQLQKRDDLHMSLGEILSEYRKKQKLTQPALADKLKAYGINISYKAVSKWETNACQPNIYTFFSICKILNITNAEELLFGIDENNPLSHLNEEGKQKVEEYVTLLVESGHYSK